MLKRDINCEKEITTEASNTINWEKDGWGFYGRVVCPTKIKHLKTCLYRHGSTAVPCHGTLRRRDEFLKNEKATAIKKKIHIYLHNETYKAPTQCKALG